uniref:MSP domain-containing protein n=1 Tax=Ascaris lumbricoides TaxID=6252 RepID=A0A9J2Q2P8_ASCLU
MPSRLIIVPARMQVSESGGTTKHRLICVGDKRLAFKVKLKPKYFKYYSVSPVIGFIQPGTTRELVFTRKAGKITHDYLVIQYIVAPSGYDPRQPFIKGSKIGNLKLKISVVEGKPKALPETAANGKFVSEEGQEWTKTVFLNAIFGYHLWIWMEGRDLGEGCEKEDIGWARKKDSRTLCFLPWFSTSSTKRTGKVKDAEKLKKPEDMKQLKGKRKDTVEKKAAEQEEVAEAKKAAEEKKVEEQKKAAEEKRAEEQRKAAEEKAAEEKKKVEEQKKAAEEKRAEEQRKAAEEKRAEDQRKAAEEKAAEEKKKVEEQKKAAEEKKVEEQKKAAEERRAEEQRKAAEEKRAEEQRKAAEEKAAEEKKKVEEQKKAAEERRAEEQRKAAEEKKKAEEQKKAAEERRAEEQRKAAEEKKVEEEERAAEQRRAEERKKVEELKKAEEKKKAEKTKAKKLPSKSSVGAKSLTGSISTSSKASQQSSTQKKTSLTDAKAVQQPKGEEKDKLKAEVERSVQVTTPPAVAAEHIQEVRVSGQPAADQALHDVLVATVPLQQAGAPQAITVHVHLDGLQLLGLQALQAAQAAQAQRASGTASAVVAGDTSKPVQVATTADGNVVTTPSPVATATTTAAEGRVRCILIGDAAVTATTAVIQPQVLATTAATTTAATETPQQAKEVLEVKQQVEVPGKSESDKASEQRPASEIIADSETKGEKKIEIVPTSAVAPLESGAEQAGVKATSQGEGGITAAAGGEAGHGITEQVVGTQSTEDHDAHPLAGAEVGAASKDVAKGKEEVGGGAVCVPTALPVTGQIAPPQQEAIEKQQQPVGDAQVSGAVKGIPEQQAAKPEEPVRQREGMETVPSEEKEKKSVTKTTSSTSTTSQGSTVSTAKPTSSDESSAKPSSTSEGVDTSSIKNKEIDYGGIDEQEYNYGGNESNVPSEHYLFPTGKTTPQKSETNSQDVNLPSKNDGGSDKNEPDGTPGGESNANARPVGSPPQYSVYL